MSTNSYSQYIKKVETKTQPKKQFGWIVNPVITVDKVPRVPKTDLNLNQILESLKNPATPALRGEYIHQIFHILLSSSFVGKNSSTSSINLDLIKNMPKLSDKDLKAIQNGCLIMSILNAKGFSLMFLEETIQLPDGKHKRMDAMFYNQELDILFIIDWKTGYSCDESSLNSLSLYANRIKELNPKTKVGMFLAYVDFGVILPGWLAPRVKRNGVKWLEPNIFKLLFYSIEKSHELDFALFSEKEIELLEEYKIPDEFKLARKPVCLEDLSDQTLPQFDTIGDYNKITTRSGKQYEQPILQKIQGPDNVEEEKEEKEEKRDIQEEEVSSLQQDSNLEIKKENPTQSQLPLSNYKCEEISSLSTTSNHQVEDLKKYLAEEILPDSLKFKEFFNSSKETIDLEFSEKLKDCDLKTIREGKTDLLKLILETYTIQELKSFYPDLDEKLKGNDKEETWENLFKAFAEDNSEKITWFYQNSHESKETFKSFCAAVFYAGMKDPSFLLLIPEKLSLDLQEITHNL